MVAPRRIREYIEVSGRNWTLSMGFLVIVVVLLCLLDPALVGIIATALYSFVIYRVGNAGHPLIAIAMFAGPFVAVGLVRRWWSGPSKRLTKEQRARLLRNALVSIAFVVGWLIVVVGAAELGNHVPSDVPMWIVFLLSPVACVWIWRQTRRR